MEKKIYIFGKHFTDYIWDDRYRTEAILIIEGGNKYIKCETGITIGIEQFYHEDMDYITVEVFNGIWTEGMIKSKKK